MNVFNLPWFDFLSALLDGSFGFLIYNVSLSVGNRSPKELINSFLSVILSSSIECNELSDFCVLGKVCLFLKSSSLVASVLLATLRVDLRQADLSLI